MITRQYQWPKTHNESLHWIFTPLRSVKTSEFSRYAKTGGNNESRIHRNY